MSSSDQDSCAQRSATNEHGTRAARIRDLNDQLRADFTTGVVNLTSGVSQLGPRTLARVLVAVRGFQDFDTSSDPHGEHDFGAIAIREHRIFWKIDYYDRLLESGSPDPTSPASTTRVLTIMLASEY